jgi:hypothetical protein
MPDIQSMIGKEVEVIANGTSYRGVLIEVSDTEVHLKSTMQWMSLPASGVSSIKLAGVVVREWEREGLFSNGTAPDSEEK